MNAIRAIGILLASLALIGVAEAQKGGGKPGGGTPTPYSPVIVNVTCDGTGTKLQDALNALNPVANVYEMRVSGVCPDNINVENFRTISFKSANDTDPFELTGSIRVANSFAGFYSLIARHPLNSSFPFRFYNSYVGFAYSVLSISGLGGFNSGIRAVNSTILLLTSSIEAPSANFIGHKFMESQLELGSLAGSTGPCPLPENGYFTLSNSTLRSYTPFTPEGCTYGTIDADFNSRVKIVGKEGEVINRLILRNSIAETNLPVDTYECTGKNSSLVLQNLEQCP